MFNKQRTHLVHWIAVIAVAMASLAPTVSQAVADAGGYKVEICSAMGTKMVSIADDSTTKQDQSKKSCPYCLTHATYALQTSIASNFVEPGKLNIYPQLFYKSPKLLTAWITPPHQAPPQLA